jgi:hypothetical protein
MNESGFVMTPICERGQGMAVNKNYRTTTVQSSQEAPMTYHRGEFCGTLSLWSRESNVWHACVREAAIELSGVES